MIARGWRGLAWILRVTGAFVSLGVAETFAYPMSLLLSNIFGPSVMPVIYRFVSRLVDSGPEVGNDYFTFVLIGFAINAALTGALSSFSGALNQAIQQGQFETYLVQPISWYSLPFALAVWPIVLGLTNATVTLGVGVLLGANIEFSQLPLALLVLVLGVAAAHAIGTLAAAVRVLSKKADPVVTIYGMAALIFSGALFPTSMLPALIRPLAYTLPHTYVISAIRRILMPDGAVVDGPSLGVSLTALVLSTCALYALSLLAFGRSLEFGRRYGVLSGY